MKSHAEAANLSFARIIAGYAFALASFYWAALFMSGAAFGIAFVTIIALGLAITNVRRPVFLAICGVSIGALVALTEASLAMYIGLTPNFGSLALELGLGLIGGVAAFALRLGFSIKRKWIFTSVGVLLRRLAAGAIDISVIIIMAVLLDIVAKPVFEAEPALPLAIIAAVAIFYKIYPEWLDGATPGKTATGIRVEYPKSGNRAFSAVVRNIPWVLFTALFFSPTEPLLTTIYVVLLAELVALFTGRRIFDYLSGTRIV